MAGLDPAIHDFVGWARDQQVVDARNKCGHDAAINQTDSWPDSASHEDQSPVQSK